MTVSIITHVFGPFYATLLAEQLRSLARYDGQWGQRTPGLARPFVFHWPDDDFGYRFAEWTPERCAAVWFPLDRPQLLNRTIGRNMAAKATDADWVWFADADYLFGPGSLESLAKLDPHAACMYFPQTVHKSDFFYDDEPDAAQDFSRYSPRKLRRAIGGAQIVPGHLARQYGYLDGVEKYHRLATPDANGEWGFDDTRGDGPYRGWLAEKTGLDIVAAEIPNVYRLRHRIPKSSRRHKLLPMEG